MKYIMTAWLAVCMNFTMNNNDILLNCICFVCEIYIIFWLLHIDES